jgi:hypothetical protein
LRLAFVGEKKKTETSTLLSLPLPKTAFNNLCFYITRLCWLTKRKRKDLGEQNGGKEGQLRLSSLCFFPCAHPSFHRANTCFYFLLMKQGWQKVSGKVEASHRQETKLANEKQKLWVRFAAIGRIFICSLCLPHPTPAPCHFRDQMTLL